MTRFKPFFQFSKNIQSTKKNRNLQTSNKIHPNVIYSHVNQGFVFPSGEAPPTMGIHFAGAELQRIPFHIKHPPNPRGFPCRSGFISNQYWLFDTRQTSFPWHVVLCNLWCRVPGVTMECVLPCIPKRGIFHFFVDKVYPG